LTNVGILICEANQRYNYGLPKYNYGLPKYNHGLPKYNHGLPKKKGPKLIAGAFSVAIYHMLLATCYLACPFNYFAVTR